MPSFCFSATSKKSWVHILCIFSGAWILTTKYIHGIIPKESEGPFAWRSALNVDKNFKDPCNSTSPLVATPPLDATGESGCPHEQTAQASLEALQSEACSLGCIAFKLPEWKSLSGRVLNHSLKVINCCFQKWDPMIFKFGITHNPTWRWTNSVYGYQHGSEKWTNMIVLFASWEPYSPAMLEATLIEKFKSILSLNAEVVSGNFQMPFVPRTFPLYQWLRSYTMISSFFSNIVESVS